MADKDADILKEAREFMTDSQAVDGDNRKSANEDTKFVYKPGAQWPDAIRSDREAENRPFLEINQLPQFVNQVVNDQRQGRPGIRVSPASGDASEEVAEIIQGMCRHIEYESKAEAAYDTAFLHAVVGGRGYWRICAEYEEGMSFNQCLRIKQIPDPNSVRIDPDYQDPDAGDIKKALVTELVSKEEFKRRWPKADAVSFSATTDDLMHWYDGEKVIVADYYRKVETQRTLVAMSDGTVGWKDELPEAIPPEVTIVREEKREDCTVEWHKIAGGEQILETYEWPGKFIPIVMVPGDVIMIEGKRVFQGLIRRARDSQMMYNFWQTAATELIALAPKAPYVGVAGQFENQDKWLGANTKSYPYLEYNPISIAGTPAPPPQRTQFAGVPTGIVEQANQCKQDLRATIGIYDPSLGQRSNETSGRAIIAREKQGDTGTFHFHDNLTRAIALTGRIIVDLMPHYYDTQRIVGTIDEEDESEMVTVNEKTVGMGLDGAVQAIVNNDIKTGRYAVTVESGPNYATKRQETADAMVQYFQAYPPAAQIGGDLFAKALDFPGADVFAERMKLMLPLQILQAEAAKEKGGQPIPPQVAAQMGQMQQGLEHMQQALQQLQAENQQLKSGAMEKTQIAQAQIAADEQIAGAVNESKERIAVINARTDMIIAGIKQDGQAAITAQQPKSEEPQGPRIEDAIMALAQVMQNMTAMHHAPRRTELVLDELGNPVGAVSAPVQTMQ